MKITKNIMLAVALLAMSVVNAKQVGGTTQPVAAQQLQEQGSNLEYVRQQQQDMMRRDAERRAAEEKLVQKSSEGMPSQVSRTVTPEQWNAIMVELTSGKMPSTARINQIKQMNLTVEQRIMLNMIEQNISLKKQLIIEKSEKEKAKQKRKQPAQQTGWFSGWFGTTGAGAIGKYKTMMVNKLDDIEKYPTLKSQKEALIWGVEFFEPGYTDMDIMKKAQKALMQELPQGPETTEQAQIDDLVGKMRNYFKFSVEDLLDPSSSNADKVTHLQVYLNNMNTDIKGFVVANITDGNVMALLRAIIAENQRITTMIDILSGKTIEAVTVNIGSKAVDSSKGSTTGGWGQWLWNTVAPAETFEAATTTTQPVQQEQPSEQPVGQ
jgi:hypothetical protein